MDTIRSSYAPRAATVARPLAALLLASALAPGCSPDPERPPRPPNVLLISLDSTRADHLGCYGYRSRTGAPTSPRLDRLAQEGVLFEHAQSTTSWTMPSHHALFSGLPDLLHGAISDASGPTPRRIELATVLADAGYATAGFFSGPYLDARYGFGGGFDLYENASGVEDSWAPEVATPPDPAVDPQAAVARASAALDESYHKASSAKRVSDRGIGWLEERQRTRPEQPFFLFLHYFDVHYDYVPPEEGYARRFWPGGRRPRLSGDGFFENPAIRAGMDPEELAGVVSYYDGEILWTDEQVGRVLDRLAALRLADDTLVVVVSDHGDEFFEHGTKGHRQNLFEPTLHAALIARLPGRLPAGARVAQRVSLVDVAPTIVDLAGAFEKADFHAPDVGDAGHALEHGMWGRSVLPLIDGREKNDHDCIGFLANRWQVRDHPVDTWALWTGSMKVLVSKRYDWVENAQGEAELKAVERTGRVFDLARDAAEAKDLSRSGDAAAAAAIARFDATFADSGALARLQGLLEAGMPPPPLSAALLNELVRLGYVGAAAPLPRLPPGTKLSQVLPPSPQFPRGD